jgi:hypothetical protein
MLGLFTVGRSALASVEADRVVGFAIRDNAALPSCVRQCGRDVAAYFEQNLTNAVVGCRKSPRLLT